MLDTVIVGGGPAGLSAAVNAGAEGLETVLIADHIGGQAGTSSRIENFIGFPEGISGPSLTERTCRQAKKFGVLIHETHVERVANRLGGGFVVECQGGVRVQSRSVVIACGVQYNVPGWAEQFGTRHGVHYACTADVVRHGGHETVVVVGGGNSAGQAAMFLSGKVKHVHLVVRSDHLELGMSHYLYDRILSQPNIEVHYNTNITSLCAKKKRVTNVSFDNGLNMPISDIYIMIGAKPQCGFLGDLVQLDEKGFIVTNTAFETHTPGIFAVGDIRSGSVKRVANAAGEGAACIQRVFFFLNPVQE